ncbi:MAG: Asparagine synthetase [Candidatus Sulfotelmatobacter sp.]|nr:Asparagine synthetase [Candidatus Sulfotelmatobacter sp.]
MKLQLGLLQRDGRPATVDDLATVLGPFVTWDAETRGEIVDGPLAMAYRGDRITWEEENEVQPYKWGACITTFDGRLDNREELGIRLGLPDLPNVPDPVIVAKAYSEFGARIFADLIGEFVLSIWCGNSRTLFFARSACGARPLYYVADRSRLIWSSDFGHLVRVSSVDLSVNYRYLLEYIISQPSTKHSPLEKVNVVPPGTVVAFRDNEFKQVGELWNPTNIRSLKYRTDHDYEDHCRELLAEAVRVRLRARPPVFSELSGGFDSSSLVMIGDRILRDQNESTEGLRTVSCVFEESESCDESPFIKAVEDTRRLPGFRVTEKDQAITLALRNVVFTGLPNPLHCFPGRFLAYQKLMRTLGARVLFSGEGGDHLFWSVRDGTPVVADSFLKGHFVEMHAACVAWSHFTNVPYVRLLFKQAFPLAMGSIFPWVSAYQPPEAPRWITRHYKDDFAKAVWDGGTRSSRNMPSLRMHRHHIDLLFCQLAAGYVNEYRDMYVTYPYSHRPLVEFCLSVPTSQFLRAGQTRSLMRRSLSEILPRKVLERRSKGGPGEAMVRALHKEWSDIADLSRWQLCERGIADPERLMKDLNKMRVQGDTGHILRMLTAERWLRSLNHVHSSREVSAHAVPA